MKNLPTKISASYERFFLLRYMFLISDLSSLISSSLLHRLLASFNVLVANACIDVFKQIIPSREMDRRFFQTCLVFQTRDQAFQSRDIRGRGASTSEEVSKSATRAGAE